MQGRYSVTVEVYVTADSPDEAGDKVAGLLEGEGYTERQGNDPYPDKGFTVQDINF